MKTYDKNNPTTGAMGLLALLALTCLLIIGGMQTAGATTYTVTSRYLCGGAGTFEQAIKDANANPGTDTIVFTAGLSVDVVSCTAIGHVDPLYPFSISATESVDIIGNGAKINGGQVWINQNGQVNDPNVCPGALGSVAYWAAMSRGFLEVGTYGIDNPGLAVSVTGLNFDNLPMLVKVEKNATFTMTDSTASNINNFLENCDRSTLFADEGAGITLRRVMIHHSNMPGARVSETDLDAMIMGGFGGGNLVLDNVKLIANYKAGRAVSWLGGTANIVSSQFVSSGGMWTDADTTDIVNSAFYSFGSHARDRISTTKGNTTINASTFYWGEPECQNCSLVQGMGFLPSAGGTGYYWFETTAVGAEAYLPNGVLYPNAGPVLIGNNTKFFSDAFTWVQDTANQSNNALLAILPNVMISFPGLMPDATLFDFWVQVVTPLLGDQIQPGVLIDVINCTQNPLLNPIDGSMITTDVFGNPRCHGNKRNIGAVQTADAPVLRATGGDSKVDLGWNTPTGTITGYEICTSTQALTDPFGGDCTGTTTPVGDPTQTTQTIGSLTNGSPYWFVIRSVNGGTPGIWSNVATATPLATVGIPVVTGTPGVNQVQLFWTEPATGGHPGPISYFVTYRVKGQTQWIGGPGNLSGRITTIPELTGGTEYEFGVAAQTSDGATAPVVGTTTATPTIRSCDVNVDGSVNKADIGLINAARNTPASGSNDLRDHNVDGVINLYDSRQCVLLCTKPLCAL